MSAVADPILASLDEETLLQIEQQLTTDTASSDDELRAQFLVRGLSVVQATRVLQYRKHYCQKRYLAGHTPIRKNKHAICFDADRRQFGLIGP